VVSPHREWSGQNSTEVISSEDLIGVLKRRGLARARRHEVRKYLVDIRVLTPSAGGHKLHREML
jgi:hypothetical protein